MNFKARILSLIAVTAILSGPFLACKEKKTLPESPTVIEGREGDTCQLSRVALTQWDYLEYEYANKRPSKVTAHGEYGTFPSSFFYDAQGRLLKVSGRIFDTSYEYDAKGRVVRENRTLYNEDVNTAIPHYGARIFEYNDADQVVKCSYVEGKGTEYNSYYVKKGEVYRYETYAYDVQGDVFSMIVFEREVNNEKFKVVADYTYFYDKQINPFYGHPAIFDFILYFGYDSGNAPAVFSKHNIVRIVEKGFGQTTYYTYTNTRYPLGAYHVPLPNGYFVDGIEFEYKNCK